MGSPGRFAHRVRHAALAATVVACCALAATCGGGTPGSGSPTGPTVPGPNPNPPTPPPTGGPEVFVGAGDIALCGGNQEATARQLDAIGGTVFTLGDNAYMVGSREEFRNCYDPSWGRHKGRTRPVPGNHDYGTPNASAYYEYFGANAGQPGVGYYSFDLGAWHIITLNSNVATSTGSAQASWLRADLAASSARCTAALWHHPLFTSGPNGNNDYMRDLYRILYDAGADLALVGHDHLYERFAPQDPNGRLDAARGMRQFVVGTGGVPLYDFRATQPNSEVRLKTHGVMKLTLFADRYDWEFLAVSGAGDSGTTMCH
jgi:acid phosphatase type 7